MTSQAIKCLLALELLVLVSSSNPYNVPHHATSYKKHARPYAFSYGVKDDYAGTNFGQNEYSDGNAVKGSYTVQLPDGRKQTVKYTADHYNGFQADVSYYGEAKYPSKSPHPPFVVKPNKHHGSYQQPISHGTLKIHGISHKPKPHHNLYNTKNVHTIHKGPSKPVHFPVHKKTTNSHEILKLVGGKTSGKPHLSSPVGFSSHEIFRQDVPKSHETGGFQGQQGTSFSPSPIDIGPDFSSGLPESSFSSIEQGFGQPGINSFGSFEQQPGQFQQNSFSQGPFQNSFEQGVNQFQQNSFEQGLGSFEQGPQPGFNSVEQGFPQSFEQGVPQSFNPNQDFSQNGFGPNQDFSQSGFGSFEQANQNSFSLDQGFPQSVANNLGQGFGGQPGSSVEAFQPPSFIDPAFIPDDIGPVFQTFQTGGNSGVPPFRR